MTENTAAIAGSVRPEPGEAPRPRGLLKIFLGYAPGVGKTRAMLDVARQMKSQGSQVLAAILDTQAGAGLEDLDLQPPALVEHRGEYYPEIDLDAVLSRRPQIALVSDLAHTNTPGLRHLKRYLDVQELLEAGIDVFATLNIQHVESLVDAVRQITGLAIRDTLPDQILDQADEIELCDLPPDELVARFQAGQVGNSADKSFFREGNLMALREMTLRKAAEWVDRRMRSYMQTEAISGPWPVRERVMVAISAHPVSERLVRAARRLADDLNAEWFAVYIETPDRLRFASAHSDQVSRTLKLAEELGAQIVILQGQSIPETMVEFARRNNITKIVAGKPLRPRWYELLRGSLIDDIVRLSGNIDIYIISDPAGPLEPVIPASWKPHGNYRRYIFSLLLVLLTTLISFPIHLAIEPTNLVMLYLLAVLFAAVTLGRGPALLASLVSVLAFDFFFVEPRLTMDVTDTQYLITFLGLFVAGLVVSSLASLLRDQVEASRRRESQTAALYALGRDLAVAVGMEAILEAIIGHISQTLNRDVVILLDEKDNLRQRAASPEFSLQYEELSAAGWVYTHSQEAGRGTNTLPDLSVRLVPLRTPRGVIGVLGVKPEDPNFYLTPEQRRLLEGFASLAALAIERAVLAEEASQAKVLSATEKLQTALLNSISHDMRTPISTITGVLSSLRDTESPGNALPGLDSATRVDLLESAWEEADRLNRYIGNLLDMTRLEAGALKISREPYEFQDIVGATLAQMSARLAGRPVKTGIPAELPMVSVDFVLIQQVLINLLDNSVKNSEPGTPVEINARPDGDQVVVQIADRGSGIPEQDLERIFDKFYRAQRLEESGGTGLGLSICRGIVEAHGGRIWAENRTGGGAVLSLSLPVDREAWRSDNE